MLMQPTMQHFKIMYMIIGLFCNAKVKESKQLNYFTLWNENNIGKLWCCKFSFFVLVESSCYNFLDFHTIVLQDLLEISMTRCTSPILFSTANQSIYLFFKRKRFYQTKITKNHSTAASFHFLAIVWSRCSKQWSTFTKQWRVVKYCTSNIMRIGSRI